MIELSVALVLVAVIVRDCFRHWVKHVDLKTFQGKQVELLRERCDVLEQNHATYVADQAAFTKKFAEDWRSKFAELEGTCESLKRHVDTTVAGSAATMSGAGRGFGRGYGAGG